MNRTLIVLENGKEVARQSNAQTIDFLSVRVGTSQIEIKESATVPGALDLGGAALKNFPDPVDAQDPATKAYVDANAGSGEAPTYLNTGAGSSQSLTAADKYVVSGNDNVLTSLNLAAATDYVLYDKISIFNNHTSNSIIVYEVDGATQVATIAAGDAIQITVTDNTGVGTFYVELLRHTGSGTIDLSAVAQNISPATASTYFLGDQNHSWAELHVNTIQMNAGTGQFVGEIVGGGSTPASHQTTLLITGAYVDATLNGTIGIVSPDDANADGVSSGAIYIESGNKTAGNGNSGDIKLQTGTSVGGSRGNIVLSAPRVALDGELFIPNMQPIVSRNVANTADVPVFRFNSNDQAEFLVAELDAAALTLRINTVASIDVGGRRLKDTSAVDSLDWDNRQLIDQAGVLALDWKSGTRGLYNPAGTAVAGWGDNTPQFNLLGNAIVNLADPTNAQDAVTKAYVDTFVQSGVKPKANVRTASDQNLIAAYNNGSSGVGATLTNTGGFTNIVVGGLSLSVGERVLIKDQTNPIQNGIYTVTTVGDGSNAWVLTRATDSDGSATGAVDSGDSTYVTAGSLIGTSWFVLSPNPAVIGVDAINFTQIGTPGANYNLSNLLATAINTDLLPAAAGTNAVGTSSVPWASMSMVTLQVGGTDGNPVLFATTGGQTPAGHDVQAAIYALPNPASPVGIRGALGIYTYIDSAVDADPTGALYIETGNKLFGTGDSGDITIQTGTSAGGNRGNVVINSRLFEVYAADIQFHQSASFGGNGITNVANPVNPQDVATKAYVDTAVSGGGGATTALDNLASVAIAVPLNPASDAAIDLNDVTHRWNSAFFGSINIDTLYMGSASSAYNLNFGADAVLPSADAAVKLGSSSQRFHTIYTGGLQATGIMDTAGATVVNTTAGFVMQTDLDGGIHKVVNLADPTNAQDAATKAYVDTAVAGATGSNDGFFFQNSAGATADTLTAGQKFVFIAACATGYQLTTAPFGDYALNDKIEIFNDSSETVTVNFAGPGGATTVAPQTGIVVVVTNNASNITGTVAYFTIRNAAGANFSLSNLGAVAVNVDLSPGTDASLNLGAVATRWNQIYVGSANLDTIFMGSASSTYNLNFATSAIIPSVDDAIDIGSATNRFHTINAAALQTTALNYTDGTTVLSVTGPTALTAVYGMSMNNSAITNVGSPGNPSDAATKGYVDAAGYGFLTFTNDNAGALAGNSVAYVKPNGNVDQADQATTDLSDGMLVIVADGSIATTASGNFYATPGTKIDGFSGLTPGKMYYVGVAGVLTDVAPSASGESIYEVGRAISATSLMFNPRFVLSFA